MAGWTPRPRKTRSRSTRMITCRNSKSTVVAGGAVIASASAAIKTPECRRGGIRPNGYDDMNRAIRISDTEAEQAVTHLRLVSDRTESGKSSIELSGVSKIYRSRDGDVP